MIPRPFCLAAAVAAALAYAAPPASADMMTLQLSSGGMSQSISYNGSPSNISGNVTGGPFTWTVNSAPTSTGLTTGSLVQTWCVDLFHSISVNPISYTLKDVSSLPNSSAIKALFGEGFKVGGVTPDAAAFQLALWELEYDTSPGSLNSGNFQYTGSNSMVRSDANALVAQAKLDVTNGVDAFNQYLNGYQLYVLDSDTKQDQIVLIPPPPNKGGSVPAPPAALLAVCGLFALGGRAAWFRRTAKQS